MLHTLAWIVRAPWPPDNSPPIEWHFPHPCLQVFFRNVSSSRAHFNTFLKSKTDFTSLKDDSHITKCSLFKWTLWCILTSVYPSLITKTTQNVWCFHQSKVFSCVFLNSICFHPGPTAQYLPGRHWYVFSSLILHVVFFFFFKDFNRHGIMHFILWFFSPWIYFPRLMF